MEVLQDSILIYNLPYTLFLGLLILYWLLVIVGALNVEIVDALMGIGDGADISVDVEPSADADFDFTNQTMLSGLLDFFYFKKVPVIILASIWTLTGWGTSMILNHLLNTEHQTWMGVLIYIPCFFTGLIAVKIFGLPLSKIFIELEKEGDAIKSVVGNFCTLITSADSEHIGVAKFETDNAILQINVKAHSGMSFEKGEKAIIIQNIKEKNLYLIDKIKQEIKEI